MYLSYSPFGDMKRTPAPPSSSFSEPSKYIVQCSGLFAGVGIWFSHHSAKKSTSACDLMAVHGLKSRRSAPSSVAYLVMRPVASGLWSISASGNLVTTDTW